MKYSLVDVYPLRQASFGAHIPDCGTVNLILPPRGMTDLCSDTNIAEYIAQAAAAAAAALPQNTIDDHDYPMAILVNGTQCSAEEQYRNAIQLKTRAGADHVHYLIIETEQESPDSIWPIRLDPDPDDDPDSNDSLNTGSTTTTNSNFHSGNSSFSIGLWSTTYQAGVAMREDIETFQNRSTKVIMSPYLFDTNNEQWDMIGTFSMFGYSQGGAVEVPNDFYPLFFSILSYALLLGSLCCIRPMHSWWAAGGRLLLRRNGQGRVTGLQYVRPANHWWRVGVLPVENTPAGDFVTRVLMVSRPAGDSAPRVLTESEFDSLPVFVYKTPSDDNKKQQERVDDNDDDDDDDDDDEVNSCVEEPDIEIMAARTSSDLHSVSTVSQQQTTTTTTTTTTDPKQR